MDKLQEHIEEVLDQVGYGHEKVAFNPFTGPDKTRPGLRPSNSNTSDLDVLTMGQGKEEDLQDYEGVEGRGGKPLQLSQVFNTSAIKSVVAQQMDLKERFAKALRKQANKAAGIEQDIQATTAFTGSDALDFVKAAGMLEALTRHIPFEKMLPITGELRGLGKTMGSLDDFIRLKALERAAAAPNEGLAKSLFARLGGVEQLDPRELAQLRAEAAAYQQFMQSPAPNPLPALGLAGVLGATGGAAAMHRLHEPYIRQLRPMEDRQ